VSEFIGIDLGTTNTVVATDARVLPMRTSDGAARSVPSVIAFPPTGGVLVGVGARRRRAMDPHNTLASTKRLIGRLATSVVVGDFGRRYPQILEALPDGTIGFRTRAGAVSSVDAASLILKAAFQASQIDAEIASAVITVPAAFQHPQREATRKAGRLAGLADVRLLEEPVAVALAHGHQNIPGRYCAVYDFGGGTFDFAVLEKRGDNLHIVAHGGDLFLGGDDLDAAFASVAIAKLLRDYNWDITTSPEALNRLILEAEAAKRELTEVETASIRLSQVDPDTPVADAIIEVTRKEFESSVMNLVRRTFLACDEVLREANLSPREMSAVFLAGGTTMSPLVHRMASGYFGLPPSHEVSPLDAIAVGASVAASTGVPLG
jgi:molecular chaperone DnaK (HSP70)